MARRAMLLLVDWCLVLVVAVAVAVVAHNNLGNEVAMWGDASAPAQNNLGNEVAIGVDAAVAAMAMEMEMAMAMETGAAPPRYNLE